MASSESQDPPPDSDSTSKSTPTAGENTPEPPSDSDGSSLSNKRKRTSNSTEDDSSFYVDVVGLSTEASTSKENEVNPRRNTSDPWNNEDLNFLADIQDFHSKKGRYPFADFNDQEEFFEDWVKGRGVFADIVEANRKVEELKSRFLKNMEKELNGEDVTGEMNLTDAGIFQLSSTIWGEEDFDEATKQESEDTGDDIDRSGVKETTDSSSKDLNESKQETGDDQNATKDSTDSSSKDPNELSKQETGDDQSDTKDPTDSSSKANAP